MKKTLILGSALLLSACAAHNGALRETDVRQPVYLKSERKIHATFPEIQRALFRHEAACGKAAVFKMDDRQASYGTLRYPLEDGAGWDRSILVDLTQMASGTVHAQVYSYTAGVYPQINAIFASIRAPGVCDPKDAPEDIPAEDGKK